MLAPLNGSTTAETLKEQRDSQRGINKGVEGKGRGEEVKRGYSRGWKGKGRRERGKKVDRRDRSG